MAYWKNLQRFGLTSLIFGLTGCVAPSNPAHEFFVTKLPTNWSAKDLELASQPGNAFWNLCATYNNRTAAQQRSGSLYVTIESQPFSKADYAVLEKVLRNQGLNSRDIQLLSLRNQTFGTGQSYLGLQCSVGNAPIVNDSFYPGIGNQWQVKISGNFVYLRGDGSPRGMIVHSWN